MKKCRMISLVIIFMLLFASGVGATTIENPILEDKSQEKQTEEYTFYDIVDHWSQQFVVKAVKHGLFVGDLEGEFNPDDDVTRAQFITVLWRMSGKESVDTKLPFKDVETQIPEFKQAIAWGYAKGYINGTSNETFEPDAPLTREEAMKILHSLSGSATGGEMMFFGIYDGTFEDSNNISQWAKPSVYWGVYNKLISGTSEKTLTPDGNTTRAQLAKILVNYLDIK